MTEKVLARGSRACERAPTFISDLQTAANELKAGNALRGHSVSSQIGATNGLKLATSEAHRVVKALAITPAAGTTTVAAAWRIA